MPEQSKHTEPAPLSAIGTGKVEPIGKPAVQLAHQGGFAVIHTRCTRCLTEMRFANPGKIQCRCGQMLQIAAPEGWPYPIEETPQA